ncbi:MAG TPA: sensor histidine kinase, partial [Candidatus Cloacimonadota bacterium]|nr:sensor histidine kinase [Candidatus Cloacimonadota bacterium]
MHHRIKNNMNTIFSLLMIQAHDQDNPTVKQILTESANRLQSMKVLYDKLFRYESYTELNLRIFIPQLLKDILGTFHSDTPVISSVELDDINLPSEYLAPLGLIINELVSNSFKYGFYS